MDPEGGKVRARQATATDERSLLHSGSRVQRHSFTEGTIAAGKDKTWRFDDSLHTMSDRSFIITMIADLFPLGFPPLAMGLTYTGLAPGIVLLIVIFFGSLYTMWAIGRTIEITGEITFRRQWETVINPSTAWVPLVFVVLSCFGCNLLIGCLSADMLSDLIPLSRNLCLIIFTAFPLLPLCLKRDLSSLTPTSMISVVLIFYTVFVMILRAYDGTYKPGGYYYKFLWMRYEEPKAIESHHIFFRGNSKWLFLVEFLVVSFLTHYNGCKYYRELEGSKPSYFLKVSFIGMGTTLVLYAVSAYMAFATFGLTAEEVILNNYAQEDTPMLIARCGMIFALLAAYPIIFTGLREAVLELLAFTFPKLEHPLMQVGSQNVVTGLLLVLLTIVALVVTDPASIDGITGALCGTTCIYAIPGLLYWCAVSKFLRSSEAKWEKIFSLATFILGLTLTIGGTVMVIKSDVEEAT